MLKVLKRVGRRLAAGLASPAPNTELWKSVAELQHAARVVDLARRRALFTPQLTEAPKHQHIVVIAPHPDDEVIGCGGTLILARRHGCAVRVVYLTSEGFQGAEQRVAEARQVCTHLGAEAVFLPFVPGRIPITEDAARQLAEAVEAFAPDHMFLPFILDDHDDHRRAIELFRAAAGSGHLGGKPTLWAYQVYSGAPLPNVVDISEAASEKRSAIALYRSEMEKRHWAHYALGQNAAASRFLPSSARERYAELFFRSTLEDYLALADTYFAQGNTYHRSYRDG